MKYAVQKTLFFIEIEQERMTCESLDALRLSRAILGSVATLSRVCLLLICNVCPVQKSTRRNFENSSHVWKTNENTAEEVFPVTSPTKFQKKDSVIQNLKFLSSFRFQREAFIASLSSFF